MGRILEPEVMDDPEESTAYANATEQAYLDRLDSSFVEHALSLGVQRGVLVDVGCGPGKIPAKILKANPAFYAVVLDLSKHMVKIAQDTAKAQGLNIKMDVLRGDSKRLPLRNSCFNFVISNSLIHHLADPLPTLNEMHRVVTRNGAILIRDLKRPGPFVFRIHAAIFGRHYSGKMRKLYEDSLQAAFTAPELQDILRKSMIEQGQVFRKSATHIGIERAAKLESKSD